MISSPNRRASSAPPARRRVTAAKLVPFQRALICGSESAIDPWSLDYRELSVNFSGRSVDIRLVHRYDLDQQSDHAETKERASTTNPQDFFTQHRLDRMPFQPYMMPSPLLLPRDAGLSPRSSPCPSLNAASRPPPSIRSIGSKNGSFRHALLKSEVSQQHPAEKDLPAPPIVTQGDPLRLEEATASTEIKPPAPTKKEASGNPPAKIDSDQAADHISKQEAPGVVCLEPNLHPPGAHPKVHNPGLVSGADFCDAGTAVERDSPIRTPETQESSPPPQIMTGRIFRTLTGGDICEAEVDVSEHFHQDHSPMMKVRPAMELISQEEPHSGHGGISKVQPADEGDTATVVHRSESSYDPQLNQPYHHGPHSHQGHHPVSKVREFLDLPSPMAAHPAYFPNEVHQGHVWVHKVQSYHDLQKTPTTPLEDPHSIPLLSIKAPLPDLPQPEEEESSRVASYWGDIPVHQGNDKEILGTTGESGESQRPFSINALQERPDSQQPSRERRSTSYVPQGLEKGNQENDPRRATQWLRELLKYRRRPSQPQLTQLPQKMHPRHEKHSHENSFDASGKRTLTAVTTFSDKNAADAHAIGDAMTNLEQLMNEALHIANHVTGPDECAHKDMSDTSRPASMHESLLDDLSGDDEHMSGLQTPPIVFIGAIEGPAHGCEALPLRSIGRRGLETPGIPTDKVRGPNLPDRTSSMRTRTIQQSGPSPILPMPPPDNQLKRYSVYPAPYAYVEDDPSRISEPHTEGDVPNSREVREYIRVFHQPPVTSRSSSKSRRKISKLQEMPCRHQNSPAGIRRIEADACSLDGGASDDKIDFGTPLPQRNAYEMSSPAVSPPPNHSRHISTAAATRTSLRRSAAKTARELRNITLRGRSHVSIRDAHFSLTKSRKRQPIARDWSPARKLYAATVACISTALIGVLIGIYAGLVPSIQYFIVDTNHYAILGNVGLYLGMALPTFFCWPLPLLHGRKPYILTSLAVAMPLLFPQALAISIPRIRYTSAWTTALLLSRALMGVALGFASMNFHSILTDLFGASLMSSKPHGELVDYCDVRRHGGGLGVWLGIWTWCFIGSLGLGFLIGALVINTLQPSWGLYISIILIAIVLILNVLTPEVRRSVWRRSVAEVRMGDKVSRRVARGEVMMHRVKDGPKWWGQEVYHGIALSLEMLRQPGFTTMAIYLAWIYAQIVLLIVLLGSLTSRYYRLHSPLVGAAVSSVAIGALIAVPFQKANIFSRARYNPVASNSMTITSNLAWTSHLVRRAIFILVLPIAGIMYAVFSYGPPIPVVVPCLFAALVGFLSCLAIAECNGIIMETWDSSDLEPGMTGRSKSLRNTRKRTNYSSFPRVTAGYAVVHSFGFIFAAGATGIGGMAQRNLGQRAATGVVAAILFALTLLLISVLIRFRHVQIIPDSRTGEMEKWTEARRDSLRRRESAIAAAKASGRKDLDDIPEDDVGWRPLIIGNPLDKNRRMNILELGSLTRWSEIRKKNRLIDERTHLNRQALEAARDELGHRGMEVFGDLQRGGAMVGELVRKVSKRSLRSKTSDTSSDDEGGQKHHMAGNFGPSGAGLGHSHGHSHVSYPAEVFTERECVMGQTVKEEAEESSSMDEPPRDDYARSRSQDHKSHQMSKVQPHAGFELQEVQGGMHYSPAGHESDIQGGRQEHASHMTNKVKQR